MKLVGLTTSLTIAGALFGALACEPARGQSPPEFLAGGGDKAPAEFFPHASPFETVPSTPHFTLGYDDLWSEYRGAEIEQAWPEAEARLAHGPRRWPLLSLLGRWLDTLFAPLPRSRKHAPCPHCDLAWAATQTTEAIEADRVEAGKFPEIPVPVPLPYDPPESSAESPIQPDRPAESRPRVEPPRAIEPAQPAEPEPPVEREPVLRPTVPTLPPVNAIPPKRPTEPEPDEPEPVEHRPRELGPTFPPVVELAPEPVIPGQPPSAVPPSALPPRNRIPQPKDRLPKNRVPGNSVPR
jgi:hypothetical protein